MKKEQVGESSTVLEGKSIIVCLSNLQELKFLILLINQLANKSMVLLVLCNILSASQCHAHTCMCAHTPAVDCLWTVSLADKH